MAKRWIVERTFSWPGWSLRSSKDYEKVQTSKIMIEVAMIRLLLKRPTKTL